MTLAEALGDPALVSHCIDKKDRAAGSDSKGIGCTGQASGEELKRQPSCREGSLKIALLTAFNGGVAFSSLTIQSLGNTPAQRTRYDDAGLPFWPSELQSAENRDSDSTLGQRLQGSPAWNKRLHSLILVFSVCQQGLGLQVLILQQDAVQNQILSIAFEYFEISTICLTCGIFLIP